MVIDLIQSPCKSVASGTYIIINIARYATLTQFYMGSYASLACIWKYFVSLVISGKVYIVASYILSGVAIYTPHITPMSYNQQ